MRSFVSVSVIVDMHEAERGYVRMVVKVRVSVRAEVHQIIGEYECE